MKKILVFLYTLLISVVANAQTAMADTMRDDGKIYVVVGVVALIFIVLFLYLIYIDSKIRTIEKHKPEK
ncbi:MAG: hypothetical protein Salg2KO_07130 [Salibacteraceae bacterium]